MGRSAFYVKGRDIRRHGSRNVYARLTAPKVDAELVAVLLKLLNGTEVASNYHFVVVGEHDSKTVACMNLASGEYIPGLGFRSTNGTRLKALLERLNEVTAPNYLQKILEGAQT